MGRNRLSRLLTGIGIGTAPAPVGDGLYAVAVEPQAATEEYLRSQLKVRALAEVLIHSKAFRGFAAAAPGLPEMVTIGKIWMLAVELNAAGDAPVWDRLVVDLPATGHGIAMLETAANVKEIARSGPIHDQAERIQQVITHPAATGVAVVAKPDELPVGEALDAVERLRELRIPVAATVLNAAAPRRFSDEEERAMATALTGDGLTPAARAAAEAALAEIARAAREDDHHARLAETGLPVLSLPHLAVPRIDDAAVARLAAAFAEQTRAPETVAR